MAWRIHDSVIRGELDNRERGHVRGKLWLEGMAEPVVLELTGNAAADLAGCLLTFTNPGKKLPLRADGQLAPRQQGTIGDLTASRKVRVLEMSVEEAYQRKKQGLPVPEHMANCLYLEWFSEANGRVVIESTGYELTISPPAWRLSPNDEQQRQKQAAEGFAGFMQKLSNALESKKHQPPEDKEWDEFDYEKFMRECDARTDKYGELLDKYQDHPDREQIIAREMGWTWLEDALAKEKEEPEDPLGDCSPGTERDDTEEDPFAEVQEDEVPEMQPDSATEGVDWLRTADGFICHPLVHRAMEGSTALWHLYEKLGLDKTAEDDALSLLSEYQITGAKLAGALDSLAYGRDMSEGPFIVACLKRALGHLHATQTALEKVAGKNLLPAKRTAELRAELFSLREEVLRLMEEFRGRK